MTETNLIEDLRRLSPPDYSWLEAILLMVLFGVGLYAVRRFLRGRRAVELPILAGTALWDSALAQLEALTHLLTSEQSREYGIRSTGILRGYIEARYALRAPTLATEEFLVSALSSPALPREHRASLGTFLERCDLLKFARYVGSADELRQLHAAAVAFVVASRPPTPPSEQEGGRQC
jgi:hypothetical protein